MYSSFARYRFETRSSIADFFVLKSFFSSFIQSLVGGFSLLSLKIHLCSHIHNGLILRFSLSSNKATYLWFWSSVFQLRYWSGYSNSVDSLQQHWWRDVVFGSKSIPEQEAVSFQAKCQLNNRKTRVVRSPCEWISGLSKAKAGQSEYETVFSC